jgi:F-type H+-transporting ATPase subunit beta
MEKNSIGKIIGISDLNIKVLLSDNKIKIKDVLYYEDEEKTKHRFEVTEINDDIALAVPFESVHGIKKGIDLFLIERRTTNRIFK